MLCECAREAWEARRRSRLLAWGHLSPPLATKTFDALKTAKGTAVQRKQWAEAVLAVKTFASGKASARWLVLSGPCGGGKTHLGLAVLNYRVDHQEAGPPGKYIAVPDFLGQIKACFDGRGIAEDIHEQYADCPLLMLDDLGAEKTTDWAREQLYRLLDCRYREERETIITTNLRPEQLPDRLADRMVDSRLCKLIGLDMESYRT